MNEKFRKTSRKNTENEMLFRRSKKEKILFGIAFAIMAVYAFTLLYSLFFLFINSLESSFAYTDKLTAAKNSFAFPEKLHWENYKKAFENLGFTSGTTGERIGLGNMFFNSAWYLFFRVGGNLFGCAAMAYALSKYRFKLNSAIYAIIIFSMTVPIVGTMGASFKLMSDLQIYNTPFFVILTSVSGIGFNFLILYGVFKNISWSYAEAVFVDGGGHFTVFFKSMLPQALTPMLALAILSGIGEWNDYLTPLLYLPDFPTVASGIYQIKLESASRGDTPSYFAGLTLSVAPVLVLYACFSDTIMKNFNMGGLKG